MNDNMKSWWFKLIWSQFIQCNNYNYKLCETGFSGSNTLKKKTLNAYNIALQLFRSFRAMAFKYSAFNISDDGKYLNDRRTYEIIACCFCVFKHWVGTSAVWLSIPEDIIILVVVSLVMTWFITNQSIIIRFILIRTSWPCFFFLCHFGFRSFQLFRFL